MAKKKAKKKEGKKKELKKNKNLKNVPEKAKPLSSTKVQPEAQKSKLADHSSNYNVTDAVKKLRSLKSPDELLAFTKGEKRLSIKRVIPAAINRLKK